MQALTHNSVWAVSRSLAATKEIEFLSLPEVTEMFQFTSFASQRLCVHLRDDTVLPYRVSPFGNLRIKARLQLPEAYRSLPRPSSPISTKASTIYPL